MMPEYQCDKCEYKTQRKSSYDKHCKSKKHYNSILKCFDCQKQYSRECAFNKHKCNTISDVKQTGKVNAVANDCTNVNVAETINNNNNTYNLHVASYGKGEKRNLVSRLLNGNVKCLDSPEMIEILNKEFDSYHKKFNKLFAAFMSVKSIIRTKYLDKFLSNFYKTPYGDSKKYYQLTEEDKESMREFKRIINMFDKLVCCAYQGDNPEKVFEPKISSETNVKEFLLRCAPEHLNSIDIHNHYLDYMGGDLKHNEKIASNGINNLIIRTIYNVVSNEKIPSQKGIISAEESLYYKSIVNKPKTLSELTMYVLFSLMIHLPNLIEDFTNAFPEVEFNEDSVDMEYIKSKIIKFVPDITP